MDFRKYWELGLSVVPVDGKATYLPSWGETYSNRLPTEEEIDLWEDKYPYPRYGVGLVCGKASGIIFIDWDTDSPDIKSLIPYSPVIRFGSKGGASAFKYNPSIKNESVERDNLGPNKHLKKKEGVEIFSDNRMIVLPPSVHPDTKKPYRWVTRDTLENFDKNDLPEITQEEIDVIFNYIRKFPNTNHKGENSNSQWSNGASSRNERLTQIVCAIICNDNTKRDEEIAEEIYNHDQREFSDRPYFYDKDIQYNKKAKGNASLAALYFTKEHRERLIKKEMATRSVVVVVDGDNIIKRADPVFPESNGLIHTVKQAIMKCSRSGGQDELATGAAIAICSTLASNRFHIEGRPATTAQYLMCVARTGKGKGAAVKIADALFNSEALRKMNLRGVSNYSSVAAFVEHLPVQRSRLDILDEFGVILKGISNGSDLKKEMEGLFCSIYSNHGGYFVGHNTKGQNKQGACYSPAVSIFANVQEQTLVNFASSAMLESGFLTRFLYFSAKEDTDINPSYLDSIDIDPIAEECAKLFPYNAIEPMMKDGSIVTDLGQVEPKREPLIILQSAKNYRDSIDKHFYETERKEYKENNLIKASFLTRQFEMVDRLAITNAICSHRREIIKDDYDYARTIVEACMGRAASYLSLIGSNTKFEKDCNRILGIIEKYGKVKRKVLLDNSNLKSKELNEILSVLAEREKIGELQKINKNDPTMYCVIGK